MQTIKIGYNAQSFLDTLNPDIENDIAALTATSKLVERHPGGGTTAKINPYKYRQGWGINMDNIDLILPPGKNDEERTEWINKMNNQPDYSYMDLLADRCLANPNLEIVWTANVFGCTVFDNIEAIAYMLERGVNIKWVECDNEAYYNKKYANFDEYAEKFVPFARAVKARWPYLKICVDTAPVDDQVKHKAWNQLATLYQEDFDCVTPHIYYGAKELPEAFEMYPAEPYVVDYTKRDESLHACFEKFTQTAFNNGAWLDEIDTLKEMFPDKTIVMTEFNTNPGDYFGNTLANEAWIFYNYMTKDPAIEAMCVQSGAGQILNCRWSNTRRQDAVGGLLYGTIRRLGYHTFKLLSEIDEINNFRINTSSMTITSPGTYYAWFVNLAAFEGPVMFQVPMGMKFNGESTINYLKGSQLYSSSGATGFQSKDQPANYEIGGVTRQTFAGVLPGYSYGYVRFEVVEDVPPPPPPPKLTRWERFLKKLGLLSLLVVFSMSACEKPVVADLYQPEGLSPKLVYGCDDIVELQDYPEQNGDDYLYFIIDPDRFAGLEHVVIFDHIATRKVLNIFIPMVNAQIDAGIIVPPTPGYLDLCGINMVVWNPITGAKLKFFDIFNKPEPFNLNKEIHDQWGAFATPTDFRVKLIHQATGLDVGVITGHADPTTGQTLVTLKFTGL